MVCDSGNYLEVIKLEVILKLKIKCNDWLLATHVRKQPITALYLEFETVLKFYNLTAMSESGQNRWISFNEGISMLLSTYEAFFPGP